PSQQIRITPGSQVIVIFFFSSRRRHTSFSRDWSSDVCSSDLESVEVGALNMARRLYLEKHGVDSDPEHLFLASNASTSGRSIAQLSKTGGTDEYRRVLQAVDQAKALADAEGASYSIAALFWLQGEFD